MSRGGVTAVLGVLIGLVAVVVAGMGLGNPGIGLPEVITGATVGVVAFLLAMAGRRVAAWTSVALALLTSALVVWVLGSTVVLTTRAGWGWAVSSPPWVFSGVFLMVAGALTGILLARAAWHRDMTPMVSVMGSTFGLLVVLIGATLWHFGLSLFPGPVPGMAPPAEPTAAAWVVCSGC